MKKQIYGRKFKRDKNERKALFSGLISAMILNGSIKTTEEKAKAVRGDIEKLVTKAKRKEEDARRLLKGKLRNGEAEKLIKEIAPGFKKRAGGYTRIIKTGRRFNDDASMVILQWVERPAVAPALAGKESVRASKKDTKKSARKSSVKTVRSKVKKENPSSRKTTKGK